MEMVTPRIEILEDGATYGKFVAEPLEQGFGYTIGNALRRVLLSSIQGAAITAIKIDGVLHQFSTIPGVKEDTTELILNLRELYVQMDVDGAEPVEPRVIRIDVHGPGEVTGADIRTPADIMQSKSGTPHSYVERRNCHAAGGVDRRTRQGICPAGKAGTSKAKHRGYPCGGRLYPGKKSQLYS